MDQTKNFKNEFMRQENPDWKFWTFHYKIKEIRGNNYYIGKQTKLIKK